MSRLDFSGDAAFQQLAKLAQWYTFPDYLKQAERETLLERPERAGAYAYPTERAFPCDTKAATYLSAVYYAENEEQVPAAHRPYVRQTLQKYAAYWGIAPDVAGVFVRHAELRKHSDADLPDSSFALVKASADGGVDRQYRLLNAVEVKAAADWFKQYLPELRAEYGFTDRRTIAEKILDKAAEFGAGLGESQETLEKHAGRGTGATADIADMLWNRAKLAADRNDVDTADIMQKLAGVIRTKAAFLVDPESRVQLVDAVDRTDRQAGLLNKYCEGLPAPEDVIFGWPRTKLASLAASIVELPNGSIYDRSQFSKLSVGLFREVFGDELTKDVARGIRLDHHKLAELACTLPRPDADQFDLMMRHVGEKPIKQGDWTCGLDDAVLAELAARQGAVDDHLPTTRS